MLKTRCSLLLPFLLITSLCYSQTTISGTVFDKKTGQSVPYTTMSLMAERVYSRADDNGNFKIYSVKNIPNDTLLFTGVGYFAVKIPVTEIKGALKISLQEDVKQLKMVTISNREMILGKYQEAGYKPNTGSFMVTHRFLKTDDFSYLKRVTVWRKTDKLSGKGKTKYRIMIFNSEDTHGSPNDVVYEQILVDDTDKQNLVIDLRKYHILLPTNSFFVGVERLSTEDGSFLEPRINASKATQHSWVKKFGDATWMKIYWRPAITATVM